MNQEADQIHDEFEKNYLDVTKFRCNIFADYFTTADKERFEQCKTCIEHTGGKQCKHLEEKK